MNWHNSQGNLKLPGKPRNWVDLHTTHSQGTSQRPLIPVRVLVCLFPFVMKKQPASLGRFLLLGSSLQLRAIPQGDTAHRPQLE